MTDTHFTYIHDANGVTIGKFVDYRDAELVIDHKAEVKRLEEKIDKLETTVEALNEDVAELELQLHAKDKEL